MTWYDHAELVAEADVRKTQPEFDPRSDLDDEAIRIVNDIDESDDTTNNLVAGVNAVAAVVEEEL